jgi:hypothetical protein
MDCILLHPTSVIGALKRELTPLQNELGIPSAAGGENSRQTQAELIAIRDHVGFDGGKLTQNSRLVAKSTAPPCGPSISTCTVLCHRWRPLTRGAAA